MTITTTTKVAAAAAAATLLLGSAAAVAATTHTAPRLAAATAKQTVQVWVSPAKGNSAVQKILLTGAIGDHGTATSTTKSGKVSANGAYVRIHLQNGTFQVNAVQFNKKLNALRPHVDTATCSAWASGSGPVTLSQGTGAYAGISGTIHISTSFALLFPKETSGAKKGTCNQSNKARPTATFNGQITGSGQVSFG
jgi:hypothetical protein